MLPCEREPTNTHDINAVVVTKNGKIVGHIPLHISKLCSYILLSGGKIIAEVIGKRENRRNNGPKRHVEEAKCILDDIITNKK